MNTMKSRQIWKKFCSALTCKTFKWAARINYVLIFSFVIYLLINSLRTGSHDDARIMEITLPKQGYNFTQIVELKTAERSFVNSVALREVDLIKNKIFWSDLSETFVPKGSSFNESMKLIKNIRNKVVKTVEPSTWKMCGVRNNAIVELDDGTIMCVRYDTLTYKIIAEALAFYLSRLLQMDNVPEVVLAWAKSTSALWRKVNIRQLFWEENMLVAMIKQIPNVRDGPVIPTVLYEAYLGGKTLSTEELLRAGNQHPKSIADIIQWGTILVFDTLICPYDRLYMWEGKMHGGFTGVLHNSLQSSDGKIWIIDNEKGFFFKPPDPTFNHFITCSDFHYRYLKTMCVFQSSLIDSLQQLSRKPSPFKTLWNFALAHEPLLDTMEEISFDIYADIFNNRLARVMQWVQTCKNNTESL